MSLCLDKPKNVSFKSDQKNNIVTVGETVKIICKAEGFPAPNYNIFHNCIKVTDNGVKIINSVNIHDGGGYVCVAKNELGQLSASFNLTVKGKNIVLKYVLVEWLRHAMRQFTLFCLRTSCY